MQCNEIVNSIITNSHKISLHYRAELYRSYEIICKIETYLICLFGHGHCDTRNHRAMTRPVKSSTITRITLRLPTELHDYLKNSAVAAGGTVTSEILSRLEVSVFRDDLAAQAREIADLKRMVNELLEK